MTKTIIIGTLLCTLGCSNGDTATAPPPTPAGQVFWTLQLNHHAVTLSTIASYDTVQLTATPISPTGAPLASGSSLLGSQRTPVTFTVVDQDTSVQVDSIGRVTARSPNSGVQIVASQTIGGVTLTDTAVLNITDTTPAPRLTYFSIQPLPGDSAKVDCSGTYVKTLTTRVEDATGTMIPGVVVHYWSSDSTIAAVSQEGTVTGKRPGQVELYAETDVYGATKSDSLKFTVGYPLRAGVVVVELTPPGSPMPLLGFNAGTVTVGVGAIIEWVNLYGQMAIDVLFDDSSAVQAAPVTYNRVMPSGGGNIPAFMTDTTKGKIFNPTGSRTRFFPTTGVYHYHSSIYGTEGWIDVK